MAIPKAPLLAFLLAATVGQPLPQTEIADPGARAICAGVSGVGLPPEDRPTPEERPSLAGCVSADLYFGFGVPADPVRARKCAYLEMERGEREPVFGGRTMLMMVYANGKGAPRNYDLALTFACTIGGAPQDVAGRVHQLARLKAANWTGTTFSICDHSSGRFLYEQCAILQDRFDKPARQQSVDAITVNWKPSDRAALAVMRQSADRFFQAHARMEADLEATAEVQEMAFLENRLIASLEGFERGDVPRFSGADLREAEAAMRAAFANTQQDGKRRWGTATPEGIKEAQRLWLAYRDAWVEFARGKYSGVGAESWKTWLTQERTAMLERFK